MKRRIIVLATVSLLAFSSPAYALYQVNDAAANASLVQTVANGLKSIGQVAQQINQLTQLISLGNLATTVLGNTVSPDLAQLFTNAQAAYSNTNSAYASVLAVPANIDRELAGTVLPPPGGWQSLTLEQMIARADRIRRLTADTAAANVAQGAQALQRQLDLEPALNRASTAHLGAKGALGGLQALGEQGAVSLRILDGMHKNAIQATTLAAQKEAGEQAMAEIQHARNVKQLDNMHSYAESIRNSKSNVDITSFTN